MSLTSCLPTLPGNASRAREGTKGPRFFDWAWLPVLHRGVDDGRHSLLIRRTLGPAPELAYYLVFAPPGTSLQAKVTALGCRWRIEENYENAKDMGLDHFEVRSWTGWYRHITLVMLALAFLVSIGAQQFTGDGEQGAYVGPPDLVPLSVPEARHLLGYLLFPLPSGVTLLLHWSAWRRRHQRLACFFHLQRRLKAG